MTTSDRMRYRLLTGPSIRVWERDALSLRCHGLIGRSGSESAVKDGCAITWQADERQGVEIGIDDLWTESGGHVPAVVARWVLTIN